jgi:hypothetical protein
VAGAGVFVPRVGRECSGRGSGAGGEGLGVEFGGGVLANMDAGVVL